MNLHLLLTGKGLLSSLLVLLGILGALALVWWLVSPGIAVGIGVGLVLLVKGLFALLSPSSD